jgi:hypothetical protein
VALAGNAALCSCPDEKYGPITLTEEYVTLYAMQVERGIRRVLRGSPQIPLRGVLSEQRVGKTEG